MPKLDRGIKIGDAVHIALNNVKYKNAVTLHTSILYLHQTKQGCQ